MEKLLIKWQQKRGHFTYITNIAEYLKIIPDGYLRGENVIYVGDDSYIGFGSKFKETPLSEEQIATDFYKESLDKNNNYKQSKYLKKRNSDQKN